MQNLELMMELNKGDIVTVNLNPKKGDEVTQAQYNDIVTKKMTEMREMYGGRGRRGKRN